MPQSVVVLSVLPLVGLFTRVLEILAPEYFECGEASLEAACHHLDQWPAPVPGQQLALPLLGTVLYTRLPATADQPALMVAPPSPTLTVPIPHQVQASNRSIVVYSPELSTSRRKICYVVIVDPHLYYVANYVLHES